MHHEYILVLLLLGRDLLITYWTLLHPLRQPLGPYGTMPLAMAKVITKALAKEKAVTRAMAMTAIDVKSMALAMGMALRQLAR